MLRFLSAGESHGEALTCILDGFPAGLPVNIEQIDAQLALRQQGYGRSSRQNIESDQVRILSGIRYGITTGGPIAFLIKNKDHVNWQPVMSTTAPAEITAAEQQLIKQKHIDKFRPGHADLPGLLKYKHKDIRNVLERASARETATRVAAGALCKQMLSALNIETLAFVSGIGTVDLNLDCEQANLGELRQKVLASSLFCPDPHDTASMRDEIKQAWQDGDSLGGTIEFIAEGLPVGLGSYTQWDEKLDGLLAQAIMSINAIKAIEFGQGIRSAKTPGSSIHDAILPSKTNDRKSTGLPFHRPTNNAGGLEGGMTNGSRLVLRAFMKPIPTLRKGLPSLSYPDFQATTAHYERSDVCAVPAASVVVEAMACFVLSQALLKKFGADNFGDLANAVAHYRSWCQSLGQAPGPPEEK